MESRGPTSPLSEATLSKAASYTELKISLLSHAPQLEFQKTTMKLLCSEGKLLSMEMLTAVEQNSGALIRRRRI